MRRLANCAEAGGADAVANDNTNHRYVLELLVMEEFRQFRERWGLIGPFSTKEAEHGEGDGHMPRASTT